MTTYSGHVLYYCNLLFLILCFSSPFFLSFPVEKKKKPKTTQQIIYENTVLIRECYQNQQAYADIFCVCHNLVDHFFGSSGLDLQHFPFYNSQSLQKWRKYKNFIFEMTIYAIMARSLHLYILRNVITNKNKPASGTDDVNSVLGHCCERKKIQQVKRAENVSCSEKKTHPDHLPLHDLSCDDSRCMRKNSGSCPDQQGRVYVICT